MPNDRPDPAVVAKVDGDAGKETLPVGINLHEFLARTLFIEAVFGATWWTSGSLIAGNDIDQWMVESELIVNELFRLPALYSDGNTVCFVFDPDGAASAFYGAATREELSTSAFATLGEWFDPERSQGPVFGLY